MKFSGFNRIISEILPQTGAFLAVFFVVMTIGYGILYFVDFVPEEPAEETASAEPEAADDVATAENPAPAELEDWSAATDPFPGHITIDRLDRTIAVLNPNSRAVADLDAALLKGVVRHPDSADLSDNNGNILILGHSSYLKNVFNKNFQAFNGIQDLTWGDTIRLTTSDAEYTYRVDRVYQAKASEVTIPTRSSEPKLTLATCDTFGAKEDRFIVEATLVAKKAL